jgi:hypothetical protein
MAGDWIKMRTDLYRDPKVSVIADALMSVDGELARHVNQICHRDMTVTRNVMRNVTVGALVSVWGVMRHQGKRIESDLFCFGVTVSVLDDIADIPGFGSAMEKAGWVIQHDDGIEFPGFFAKNNVDPEEKSRQKNAERQRRFREKNRAVNAEKSNVTSNVTDNVTVTHREEKRREDITPPLNPPPKGDSFDAAQIELPPTINRNAWAEWVEYRKSRRKKISEVSAKKSLALLGAFDHFTQQRMVDEAIRNDWQGLFAPKGPHVPLNSERRGVVF